MHMRGANLLRMRTLVLTRVPGKALVVAALLLLITDVDAASRTGVIDLRHNEVPQVVGPADAGNRLSSAGDVNGDGYPDFLIGSCGGSLSGSASTKEGSVYVVFGRPDLKTIDLTELGSDGFEVVGADNGDSACRPTDIGDINGDGLDDIVVGAPFADNNERGDSGSAYVIFGKTDSDPVDLTLFDLGAQGTAGYRIDGAFRIDYAGHSVAAPGDMNGDGIPDLILAAPFAARSYVVFLKEESMTPIDLLLFDLGMQGDAGFVIRTPSPATGNLYEVASAGDANGDQIPDVAVGVTKGDNGAGSAYVVFGGQVSGSVDVREPGGWDGYRIRGARSEDTAGYSMAPLGDLNGDGKDDLLVGAPRIFSDKGAGSAYVVFGKDDRGPVHLADLQQGGYKIKGISEGDTAASSVAGLGDINSDGIPDFVIGVAGDNPRREGGGSAYVVFGKKGSGTIRLRHLRRGFAIYGAGPLDFAGAAVAGMPDLDDDGVSEVLVGAPGVGKGDPGVVYVVPAVRP